MRFDFASAVAHVAETGRVQTVAEHLSGVAKLSADIGKEFGLEKTGYLAGLLHDIGKITPEFQAYIKAAQTGHSSSTRKVDHSTYGAKILYDLFNSHDNLPIELA